MISFTWNPNIKSASRRVDVHVDEGGRDFFSFFSHHLPDSDIYFSGQKIYCHFGDLFKLDCKCPLGLTSDIAWPFPPPAACLSMHSRPR